jgi:predicted transcriptional regulator
VTDTAELSRRERQIMEVVWRLGEASATSVVAQIEDPPSRTSVRTIMRILEEKGHLTHRLVGREFVYRPARPPQRTGQTALRRVLHTFFGGSFGGALAAHLADPDASLDEAELRRLSRLIKEARGKRRRQ